MPSKRYKQALEARNGGETVSLKDAVDALGKFPRTKFDESVDLSLRLGVDPKHSDQMVRGTVALPNGSGKTVRVAVFAPDGPGADAAKKAGADHVGKISFDAAKLLENAEAALTAVMKAKPDSTKGNYLLSAAISTTMGPSVKLDLKEIANLG
jgi:ribosomal protein L1